MDKYDISFKMMFSVLLVIFLSIMSNMVLAVSPFTQEFNEFITIENFDIQDHLINTNKSLENHVINSNSGMPINTTLTNCSYELYKKTGGWDEISSADADTDGMHISHTFDAGLFNTTGSYGIRIICECLACGVDDADIGGFTQYSFNVYDDSFGTFQLWTCPDSYTGILIMIGLAILLIMFAIWIKEPIFGILGGLTLTSSYLFIGACAPLMTSPLVIAGILITVLFSV